MDTAVRIPVHSITDLITNSSTTIYTYSDRSEKALREMINEVLSVLRTGKRCEDLFHLSITLDGDYEYTDWLECLEDDDVPEGLKGLEGKKLEKVVKEAIEAVKAGGDKPAWMKEAEEYENGDGFRKGTTLNIVPKLPTQTCMSSSETGTPSIRSVVSMRSSAGG
jgi:hypothetical protein